MKYHMGVSLLAMAVSGACGNGDVTSSINPAAEVRLSAMAASADRSPERGGKLVVKKECHTYAGQEGGICTIIESSLPSINGATITYASAAVNGLLNTAVTLDPPAPGRDVAFGHCSVNLGTGLGTCTFSGGRGKFKHFRAKVDVTPLGWPNFAWHGTYSFGQDDREDDGDDR